MGNTSFTILTFFACLLLIITLYIKHITGSNLNEKRQCGICRVVSRKGIWDLYNSNLGQNESYDRFCPVCEKLANFDKVNISSPLSPRLGLIKRFNIARAIKNNMNTSHINKQLELYLKVQNDKLKKMT